MNNQQNQARNIEIGKKGEEIACGYLINKGCEIVERNHWRKWGEIDIICLRKGILHFVEVKTVTRETWSQNNKDSYEAQDNMHLYKTQRLKRVIETYLLENKVSYETKWQIDILLVYVDRDQDLLKVEPMFNVVFE